MLQKINEMPSRSKCTVRDVPASYKPRSKRLPLNSENTLWNHGSRLGNSTLEPRVITSRCGSKALFFCVRTACIGAGGARSATTPAGVSHTTLAVEVTPSGSAVMLPLTLTPCALQTDAIVKQHRSIPSQGAIRNAILVVFRTTLPSTY